MNTSYDELTDLRPDLEGTASAELHQLIERAHQIELLTQHPGWPLFRDYLIGLSMSSQNYILSGACKNLDEYRDKTGFVKGLRAAMDAPSTLLERVSRMQAEADQGSL
jgi:hypothetical protein